MSVTYDLTNPTTTGLVKITNLMTALSSLTRDNVELTDKVLSFSTSTNITSMALNDKIEVILADATEYMKSIPDEEQYDIVFIVIT